MVDNRLLFAVAAIVGGVVGEPNEARCSIFKKKKKSKIETKRHSTPPKQKYGAPESVTKLLLKDVLQIKI